MTDEPRHHYGDALGHMETAELALAEGRIEVARIYADLASASASLANYDATLNLRDHLEATPARLERRLRGD